MAAAKKYDGYLEKLKLLNISKRFGKLTVADVVKIKTSYTFLMACDCGATHRSAMNNVVSGNCFRCKRCSSVDYHKSIGISRIGFEPESRAWRAMIKRCYNPNTAHFSRYGGRGIKVCPEWVNNCSQFILDMGKRPTHIHSLDRIDNNKNYSRENCRWATKSEQAINRSTNVFITAYGKTQTVIEWSRETGIHRNTLLYRIRSGKPPEECLKEVQSISHYNVTKQPSHNP